MAVRHHLILNLGGTRLELSSYSLRRILLLLLHLHLRSRAPSAAPAWPDRTWSATGKCSRAGHPATATPPRIPRVPQPFRCTQIPGGKRRDFHSYKLKEESDMNEVDEWFNLKSGRRTFLHARTIFFRSYSAERPCTVVSVFRPLLCCILMCTSPSCTSSLAPLIASANGSEGREGERTGHRVNATTIIIIIQYFHRKIRRFWNKMSHQERAKGAYSKWTLSPLLTRTQELFKVSPWRRGLPETELQTIWDWESGRRMPNADEEKSPFWYIVVGFNCVLCTYCGRYRGNSNGTAYLPNELRFWIDIRFVN